MKMNKIENKFINRDYSPKFLIDSLNMTNFNEILRTLHQINKEFKKLLEFDGNVFPSTSYALAMSAFFYFNPFNIPFMGYTPNVWTGRFF